MNIHSADNVRVPTLANGFRVATDRMDSVETTSLGVWAGVGTRNEPAEHNGVAHLLEHMAFKGTRRRSARDIVVEIKDVGGFLNAYTGREQTAYYAKVLAEDTPLVVDILADILQNSVFDADELTRERAVVLQEIGQAEDTPDDIIFDHFQEIAFPDQAMGRPVLGRAEIGRGGWPARRGSCARCRARPSPPTWPAAIAPARWCWLRPGRSTTTRWWRW